MERLRTAWPDTYDTGGDYDALVKTVQDVYEGLQSDIAGRNDRRSASEQQHAMQAGETTRAGHRL